MTDLPQQPPDCEIVIPIGEQKDDSFEFTQDDLTYSVIERPILPITKLEEKDLFNVAHYLSAHYSQGFTWSELPYLLNEILSFIAPNPVMSIKEKQKATIQILHYIMVTINPLYLPEKATGQFFEELLPPFIELALKFPEEKKAIQPSRLEILSETALWEYVNHISTLFQVGMGWKDLASATRYALTYILSYAHLTFEDQHDGVFAIMENLITQTQGTHLPQSFDQKLFKTFISSYLETILRD